MLKTRALTEQLYVDEVENDEEGIAEMLMDDNAIASVSDHWPFYSLLSPTEYNFCPMLMKFCMEVIFKGIHLKRNTPGI